MNFIDIIIQIEKDGNKNGKYYFIKKKNRKLHKKSRKVIFKGKTLRLISIIVWSPVPLRNPCIYWVFLRFKKISI